MKRELVVVAALIAVTTAGTLTHTLLLADTLVLTNGRRVQGDLVGVQRREIEFEERGSRRILRIPRDEISRIEFDADRSFERDDFSGGGIPRGMRERQIGVDAREPWTDTGVDLRAGQAIYFSASGEVRWGPGRRDGAAGGRNSPDNPGRPLPDRPAASLIGRIGERDEFFFIGADAGPYRARSSGRLYLGLNDDFLQDNSGALRVTVYH